MSTHLKANQAYRGTIFMIYSRFCENSTEFSEFLKICNLTDNSLKGKSTLRWGSWFDSANTYCWSVVGMYKVFGGLRIEYRKFL